VRSVDEAAVLAALGPDAAEDALAALSVGPRAIDCPHLGTGRLVFPRYREVRFLLRDPRFNCAPTAAGMLAGLPDDLRQLMAPVSTWILYADPPLHARLRALLAKAFTARHVAALEQSITREAGALVRAFSEADGGDAVGELAVPLPVRTISRLMGIDSSVQAQLKAWSDDVVLLTEPQLSADQERRLAEAWLGLSEYFTGLIDLRRCSPMDDIVSALAHAEVDGARLSDEELVANCVALLVGGHETTASLLSSLILAAFEHRVVRERVLGDAVYAAQFVEEVLRLYGPSKITARTAACDVDVHGVQVRAGTRLILLQATANRDPEVFDNPNAFWPQRRSNAHVAFGFGAHACFGAALARLQAVVFLRAFIAEVERFELDHAEVVWKDSQVLRTAARVPVRTVSVARGVE
jgi:cytochrome P450